MKELHIVNFKNIGEASLDFSPGVNCFVGRNGAGKTNVLDAVYHLSMCKSFFGLPDGQHIRHGEAFFVVQGSYDREGEAVEVYCGVKRGGKKVFKKNQKVYGRLSEHIGLLPLVMVSPEDGVLIEGGSEERRRLVDGIICQCDRDYLHRLIRYNKVLMQRNSLLKSAGGRGLEGEALEAYVGQVIREALDAGFAEEEIVISSGTPSHLTAARKISTKLFVHDIWVAGVDFMAALNTNGGDYRDSNAGIAFNVSGLQTAANYAKAAELVREAHSAGLQVCLRAGDDLETVRIMQELGLDYIPTNCVTKEQL